MANTIIQVVKNNALVCAHKLLGYRSGTSQISGKQIDHILISPGILPSIIRGGYIPYAEEIISDHRALFLDLTLKFYLEKEQMPLQSVKYET